MSLFSTRLRGFRIVDLVALVLLLTIAVTSYAFKTLAGAQGADTAGVESRIAAEHKRIRLLDAEISHLEDPGRIERLSSQYLGLAEVTGAHDVGEADLKRIAGTPAVGATPAAPSPEREVD
ncbi:MAG: hypothetical protein ABI376_05080 [Caulobacteraceae bacterium]